MSTATHEWRPRAGARPGPRIVWRLYRRAYGVGLDGAGGRFAAGRWNHKGKPIVYTAGSASLCILERLVHLDPSLLPADLMLARIEIPSGIKAERTGTLPRNWFTLANLAHTRRIGMAWLASGTSAILEVPSAIVPEETNALLNPAHPDSAKFRVTARRQFRFDERLFV